MASPGAPSTFLTRVRIRDYRSIAGCDVALGPLTILVGPNGAGKSNFLDALRFTAESLRDPLGNAIRERGGYLEIARKAAHFTEAFGIRLDFELHGSPGFFAFEVAGHEDGGYVVANESCTWQTSHYEVHMGNVEQSSATGSPRAFLDRLYLVNASGVPEFRPIFDALSTMGFYNPSPAAIRALHPLEPGGLLEYDAANLANVIERSSPSAKQRIEEYLARIVPEIEAVSAARVGSMTTINFLERAGAAPPRVLQAINMSDGTLRALAALTAVYQHDDQQAHLIGIEEPETALYPAAAEILLAALREAARDRQILLTTHSPDLLDGEGVTAEQLLAVSSVDGETVIGPIDFASRTALADSLYRAGELLRLGQLEPDRDRVLAPDEIQIFEPAP